MLLDMEPLYNPTVHLTPAELMEKFNLAFYEGQNLSKSDLVSSFPAEDAHDNYLVDYLITNDNAPQEFDFDDFVRTFDENRQSSTDSSLGQVFNNSFDLDDIDLCDESLDLDTIASDLQDLDELSGLPPISTITSTYLRNLPDDDLSYTHLDHTITSDFGHLIGTKNITNNDFLEETHNEYHLPSNQIVLNQTEALLDLNDDPFLSSTTPEYRHRSPRSCEYQRRPHNSESESAEDDEVVSSSSTPLQCLWEHCFQIYDSQTALVKHIEKCHVEVKRGEEFTCFWSNCPRKIKPFNARYKLLIHMRVHSGEKPNKCPFEGCSKAFSRLENLKIHQRSHTGERPYLCQFPTCTKSFSNSSDRAKHQRTHFDTKPYACQVLGCTKKYTDPSSLRKHVKNHTSEEQLLVKRKSQEECFSTSYVRKFFDPNRQKAVKIEKQFYASAEHNYSNRSEEKKYDSSNIRQDLKNKISEKNKLRKSSF